MAEEAFTQAQWEAGRLLVARLQAEASGWDYDESLLGVTWKKVTSPVVGRFDTGTEFTESDLLHSSMAMLWYALVETALVSGEDPADVVGKLGVALANYEPA